MNPGWNTGSSGGIVIPENFVDGGAGNIPCIFFDTLGFTTGPNVNIQFGDDESEFENVNIFAIACAYQGMWWQFDGITGFGYSLGGNPQNEELPQNHLFNVIDIYGVGHFDNGGLTIGGSLLAGLCGDPGEADFATVADAQTWCAQLRDNMIECGLIPL